MAMHRSTREQDQARGRAVINLTFRASRKWAVEALRAVGVDLLEDQPDVVPQGKPQWDYVNEAR